MKTPINSQKKCIVLTGCMGCGKTTIGQELHHETGLPFVDIDHFIEETEKMSIKDIFAKKGERYFRDLETAVLQALCSEPTPDGSIISTGGGIVIRPENRKLLRRLGFVVWIKVNHQTLFHRISRNKDRPLLLTENPQETLRKILQTREPWYMEAAHLIIETAPLTIAEASFGIIESARHHFSSKEAFPIIHPPHAEKETDIPSLPNSTNA